MVLALALIASAGVAYAGYRFFRHELNPITEFEFYKFLKQEGLYEHYTANRLLCSVTGEPIMFNTLGYIQPKGDRYIFISEQGMRLAATLDKEELEPALA